MNIDENNSKILKSSSFDVHPSKLLNELYKIKNYQGANPEFAKVLFVGRDPNWHIDVENLTIFTQIEEYLSDGTNFWEKYDYHHPFLSPEYKGDGRRYHKMFSKLNINSSFSNDISFIELIGFPTTGMAKKNDKEFKKQLLSKHNQEHLVELDEILKKKDKIVFLAWGLLNDFTFLNKKLGLFENLSKIDKRELNINDLNKIENIYIHKHFSDSISNKTLDKISKAVNSELT